MIDDSKPSSGASDGAAPANYSRGEGQKPVTSSYRDNWDAIYGTKTNKQPRRAKTAAKAARKPAGKSKKAAKSKKKARR